MDKHAPTLFFIGKPGCGKGTQAKLLSERTGWPVLSSGTMFRAIAEEDTQVGLTIRDEIDHGFLAPHWFAMYLYLKSLFSLKADSPVIFDGFNRKEEEARLIIDSLAWLQRPYVAIEIAVSDEEVRARLEHRKEVQGREDDHYVETRLEEYAAHTTKALQLFKDIGTLVTVDGSKSPEEVALAIDAVLGLV